MASLVFSKRNMKNFQKGLSLIAFILILVVMAIILTPLSVYLRDAIIELPKSIDQCHVSAELTNKRANLAVPAVSRGRCSVAAMTTYDLLASSPNDPSLEKRVHLVKELSKKLDDCFFCGPRDHGMLQMLFSSKASEWLGGKWVGERYWTPQNLKAALDKRQIIVVALNSQLLWAKVKSCGYAMSLEKWNGRGGSHFVVIFGSQGSAENNSLAYWVADGGISRDKDNGAGYDGEQEGAIYLMDAETLHRAMSKEQDNLIMPTIFFDESKVLAQPGQQTAS